MAIFDWLTGTRRPATGVPVASPDEVHAAILAVNRATAPFVIRPGTQADGAQVDLVAEWRLFDPAWYAIFAPVEAKQLRILMRLVPARAEVRAIDRMRETAWSAGVPTLAASSRWQAGQVTEISFNAAPFVETSADGRQFRFVFRTGELKDPLRDAVTGAGWTWRGAVGSL